MVLILVVVFAVCIGSDGAVNNMEWIREGLVMTTMTNSHHELEKHQIAMVTNHVTDMSGNPSPFVLVLATSEMDGTFGMINDLLERMTPTFRLFDLNTTGILWVTDSNKYGGGGELCDHGRWMLHTMSLKNATCMECLVNFLVNRMHVGVMYFKVQSDNFEGPLHSLVSEWMTRHGSEDIVVVSSTTQTNPGGHYTLVPPIMPSFMRSDMFMVFETPNSVSLFSDACMWFESIRSKLGQRYNPEFFTTSGYAVNIFLNDGRELHQLEQEKNYNNFYVQDKNTNTVPLQYIIYPDQYLFWPSNGNITQTSFLNCRVTGVACCKVH